MTTKYEYNLLNQLIPEGFFEEMDAFEDPDDTFNTLEDNHSIKEFIAKSKELTGKTLSSSQFGRMIGINVGNTIRAKLNGYSRFSQNELERIHELTNISMETLLRENAKNKHNKAEAVRLGRYVSDSLKVYFENKSGACVERICLYPENSDEEYEYKVDSKDSTKDMIIYYPVQLGRHFDAIVYFTNGTETYIDDVEPADKSRITLMKNNEANASEPKNGLYTLLVKIPKGEYFPAMNLNKKQARHFIEKYGNTHESLQIFFNKYGGSVCDGKYYIVEDF